MTEKNEMGSVSHAAERCVELPAELMSERLCVVYLYFRQWTGTVSMCQGQTMGLPFARGR